jgi:hypothetical protein
MDEDEDGFRTRWLLRLGDWFECYGMRSRDIVSVEEVGSIKWTSEARHFLKAYNLLVRRKR